MLRSLVSPTLLFVSCFLVSSVPACAAPLEQRPQARPVQSAQQLPLWYGPLAEMFDDRVDRTSLDTGSPSPPGNDPYFRPRAQAADFVIRGRITSFTFEGADQTSAYHIGVTPVGPPLGGPALPPDAINVQVARWNPFFAVLRTTGASLLNRTFVMFIKQFAGNTGPELHWYMSAESPQLLGMIHDVQLLKEVRSGNPR